MSDNEDKFMESKDDLEMSSNENKYKCKYRQIAEKYYTSKCQYLKRTKRINYYGSIHTGTDGII